MTSKPLKITVGVSGGKKGLMRLIFFGRGAGCRIGYDIKAKGLFPEQEELKISLSKKMRAASAVIVLGPSKCDMFDIMAICKHVGLVLFLRHCGVFAGMARPAVTIVLAHRAPHN